VLFHDHPVPKLVYDAKTLAILEVNEAALHQYGYSRGEFLALTIADIRVPGEPEYLRGPPEQPGEVREERHRSKDGRVIEVQVSSRALVFNSREAKLLSAVDVTAHNAAVEKLRESAQRLSRFVRFAPVAIAVFDRDMNYLAASDRWFSDYGIEDRRIIGRSYYDVIPDLPERWHAVHRRCLSGAVETNEADPWVRSDGRTEWVRWECQPWQEQDGAIGGLIIHSEIVTERKQKEEELRESLERFSRTFHAAPVAMGIVSLEDMRFIDVNEAALHLLGYSREEFVGHSLDELDVLVNASDRSRILEALERDGTVRDFEMSLRSRSGELRHVMMSFVALEWEGQRYALGTAVDLTALKSARADLDEQRLRTREAAAAGNVGAWDWDLRTNRVYFSPEWKRHIGYAEHEISEDFSEWEGRLHPEDHDRCLRAVEAFLSDPGPVFELEFRLRHKDGSYRHILSRGSLLRDPQGQPVRLLGSHVDVTEREALQAQLLQAQKMESVGRLAGGIAHDFNNLLTVINGTADLILMDLREGDPLRADLEEVRRAGERGAQLTRQLLAFSRKQILQPTVLSLNTVIADMQSMLRRLLGEDVILACTLADDLGSVRVDRAQIEQVLLNLTVNARDAMPGGGTLTIATRNVERDEAYAERHPSVVPGPYVLLSISDTGVGMDQATQARIFEPFFTTKGPERGTGLGLSTAWGIVKQSGGSIEVYSEVGKGTSFHVYLPRVEAAADRSQAVLTATVRGGGETILVVEDEEGLRHLAERALKSAGYRVLTAANGGEALLLLERLDGPVHLMLTDVVMPGMSGRDLAERLREMRPGMKVLYTSGYTDDIVLQHGVLDDVTDFLGKPYTVVDLTRRVREVLDRQG
jgi:PAS domain S-box-containing protein